MAQGAGIAAPWLYGRMIETSIANIAYGYMVGAGLMLIGAAVELVLGVKAERRLLEHIAAPLSAHTVSDERSS